MFSSHSQIPARESWNGELIGYTVNCSEEKQNINYISVVNNSLKSVIVSGWATTKATLRGLRKYTRYAVTVRALNSFGSGPWSAAIFGTTAEGGKQQLIIIMQSTFLQYLKVKKRKAIFYA